MPACTPHVRSGVPPSDETCFARRSDGSRRPQRTFALRRASFASLGSIFLCNCYLALFKMSATMSADLYPAGYPIRWLLDHEKELELVELPLPHREAMRNAARATPCAASAAPGAPAAGGDKSPVSTNHGFNAFPVSCLGPPYLVEKRATLGTTPSSSFRPSSANQGWC